MQLFDDRITPTMLNFYRNIDKNDPLNDDYVSIYAYVYDYVYVDVDFDFDVVVVVDVDVDV